jgi:signal recognition particle receptor subunit beta
MVQINFALREVNCKVVYYGPGLSGKTTNLELVHQKVPPANRGELTSIATEGDRTLFFDFMPLDLGKVAGMTTRLQLYTVPGQVYYNATRKLVLQGADGIVFVADSQQGKMEENIESLNNLEENLKEHDVQLSKTPCVMQYNKRDLPNVLPVEELEAKLNRHKWPYFESIAITGEGVLPTLKKLAGMVLETLNKEYGVRRPAAAAPPKKEPLVSAPAAPTPPPAQAPSPPAAPAVAPPPAPAVAAASPRVAEPLAAKLPVSPPPKPSAPAPRPTPLEPREPKPATSARRPAYGAPAQVRETKPQEAPSPIQKKKSSSRLVPVIKPEPRKIGIPKKAKVSDTILFAVIMLVVGVAAGTTIEHFLKILGKLLGPE